MRNLRSYATEIIISLLLLLLIGLIAVFRDCGGPTTPSTIVDRNHIRSILEFIKPDEYNKDTLVIFDIDNTLLTPRTDLGSDQWFYDLLSTQKASGLSVEQAIDSIMPIYTAVLNVVPYITVEPDAAALVNTLQDKGVSVIALTARSFDIARRTVEQLHDAGIFFNRSEPYECPIVNAQGRDREGLYIDGIIFSGSYSKGEMIDSWLNQTHFHPKKIIFIDDKMKNLISVAEPLSKHGYPFVGIRYGYLDERVKKYDAKATEQELQLFFREHPDVKPIPAEA